MLLHLVGCHILLMIVTEYLRECFRAKKLAMIWVCGPTLFRLPYGVIPWLQWLQWGVTFSQVVWLIGC